MKYKILLVFLIVFIFTSSCNKRRPPETACIPTGTPTPQSSFIIPTMTSTPTTTIQLNTLTATITNTIEIQISPTPTFTATNNCEQNICCYNPVIGDFEPSYIQGYFYYWFDYAGGTINARVYTYFPDVQLKLAIYDGAGYKLDWDDNVLVSDSNGFISKKYYLHSVGNTLSAWHIVAFEKQALIPDEFDSNVAGIIDIQEVHVAYPRPTPLGEPPCMDMPALYADEGRTMENYDFKYNTCTVFYYSNRYLSIYEGNVAYYDGNDDLITYKTEYYVPGKGRIDSFYHVTGIEAPGTWHIALYPTSITPPAKFNTSCNGCIGTCPPFITLKVK